MTWWSTSPKTAKSLAVGYAEHVLYLAPHSLARDITGDKRIPRTLCGGSTEPCREDCLAWHSGMAGILATGSDEHVLNSVRGARLIRTVALFTDREASLAGILREARRLIARTPATLMPAFRPNGGSDLPWLGRWLAAELQGEAIVFDYTKHTEGLWADRTIGYHRTLSFSGVNLAQCREYLAHGGNVAAVFHVAPTSWHGFPVASGDTHDIRPLDPPGHVVSLTPKGHRARRTVNAFFPQGVAA